MKVKINYAAVGSELLKGAGTVAMLESMMAERAGGLGEGYEITTHIGKSRANVSCMAVSKEARLENEESNTLLGVIS